MSGISVYDSEKTNLFLSVISLTDFVDDLARVLFNIEVDRLSEGSAPHQTWFCLNILEYKLMKHFFIEIMAVPWTDFAG